MKLFLYRGHSTRRIPVSALGTQVGSLDRFRSEQKFRGVDGSFFVAAASALALASMNTTTESDGEHKSDSARWENVVDACVPAVVSIKVNATRSFDTNSPGASQATGFIVDAKQGLVLTNRHVVQSGPVLAEALFQNHEEIPLRAVYRDPVHDFGLFQFDPKKLKHFNGPLPQLELCPECARVGMDIRVMGNNAGEKLSILSGTLARLDRQAPEYGRSSFNDHNTFYFQAASNTSGGSSGSPVINADGKVVALNAAGMVGTASSYYLPLERVKRAVDLIRQGKPVTRGTLQTTFNHRPFNELQRVGLPTDIEAQVRREVPKGVGMLSITSLVPGGTGALAGLEPGDVLLKMDGKTVTLFPDLEAILDDRVGESIQVEVLRGGIKKSIMIPVQNLHSITPASFIEMGDSVFHDLSYHMARNHSTPVVGSGVYVCQAGYMLRQAGVSPGSLIMSVDNVPTPDLKSLEEVFKNLKDGSLVPVRVRHVSSPQLSVLFMMTVDKTWFSHQRVDRLEVAVPWMKNSVDEADWQVTPYSQTPTKTFQDLKITPLPESKVAVTKFAPGTNQAERAVANSLVQVNYNMPYMIDGTSGAHFTGTGLVVDAEKGWIIVDRNTVPGSLGDVRISFGSSLEVEGKVIFIHPLHNLSVIGYDPKKIGETPVKAATLTTGGGISITPNGSGPINQFKTDIKVFKDESDAAVKKRSNNSQLSFVTLSGNRRTGTQLFSKRVSLSPLTHTQSVTYSHPPRFQETNLETVLVEGAGARDGVIVNEEGKVAAFWGSFSEQAISNGRIVNSETFQGLPAEYISELIEPLKEGRVPEFRTFGAEFEYIGLSQVRGMGLDDESISTIADSSPRWPPRLLAVKRRWGGFPAHSQLQDGDVLLSVGGKTVSTFREVELACNASESGNVELVVLRNGGKVPLTVGTTKLSSDETNELLLWGGAVLQAPPSAVARQRGILPHGVYVASHSQGSPANKYGLQPTHRITEVDGEPTKDLKQFISKVKHKKHGDIVRIKQEDLRGVKRVFSMKLDLTYWPTYQVMRDESSNKKGLNIENRATWKRTMLPPVQEEEKPLLQLKN